MNELQPGTILHGKYCVEKRIAEGGMSLLYCGHPLQGAGRVAIKQLDLPEGNGASREDVEQFEKEYQILQSLEHEGLARALDFFSESGRYYLVEEFVPGETLDAHVRKAGRLSVDETVDVMDQLLAVLEYLHGPVEISRQLKPVRHGSRLGPRARQGRLRRLHPQAVVYRDLKPQNIILQPRPTGEDGEEAAAGCFPYTVRLVDFGAARRWKRGATADTVPLGTPGYAPPEQYGKAQSDARSDVYGAGVLLHYMLTGCAPDPARGWTFEEPHRLVPQVPSELSAVVMKAVEVEPARRFCGAPEMRRAVMRAAGRDQHCSTCGAKLQGGKPCSRCPSSTPASGLSAGQVLAGLAALAVVAFVVGTLATNFLRARAGGQLSACRSNLMNIGTAVEIYSTDNDGRFPTSLRQLNPNYLRVIPTCPSAGSDTYSSGYNVPTYAYRERYTVVCHGLNHVNVNQGENFPQYTSTQGFISQ